MMDGRDFMAVRTLSSKAADGSTVVVAEPGQTCEKVAPSSLGWLAEQGHIKPAPARPAPKPIQVPAAAPASPVEPGADEAVH